MEEYFLGRSPELFWSEHNNRRQFYRSLFPEQSWSYLHIPVRFALNSFGIKDETQLATFIASDARKKLAGWLQSKRPQIEYPMNHEVDLDVRLLASALGVRLEEKHSGKSGEGLLVPVCGGFKALIYPAPKPVWRFTVCHELAHTYFYDRSKEIPQRPGRMSPDDLEQYICDDAARYLLRITAED